MEIREILNNYNIIGIIGNYKSTLNENILVKDIIVKKINEGLKMVGLNNSYLDKKISDLTISEKWKIDLLSKLDEDIIVIGNLSNTLINKDIEYMKKLFKMLLNYHKKLVIIDSNLEVFFNLVKRILVIRNHDIVYETSDFYDDELSKYVNIPKIIDFIKYVNYDKKRLNETTDIHELIKDIYRSVS